MAETLKMINAGLAFFLELAMLAAFAYWGFYGDKSVLTKWALGIGLPLVVAAVWGILLAPQAAYRLNITGGAILSLILFLLAAVALYQTQHHTLAIVFAVLAIINQTLMVLWKQW
jgi:hypothetical protein